MTQQQQELAERIRSMIAEEPLQREVPMFGTRAFLVREKILVCARKNGGLLVRVSADRHQELLRRPGAAQAVMGPARDMGPGWIEVAAEAIATDAGLGFWVDAA